MCHPTLIFKINHSAVVMFGFATPVLPHADDFVCLQLHTIGSGLFLFTLCVFTWLTCFSVQVVSYMLVICQLYVSYMLVICQLHVSSQQCIEKAVLLHLKIMTINCHFMVSPSIVTRHRSAANCTCFVPCAVLFLICTIQNCTVASSFVWVWNLVCHINGRT